MLDYCWSNTRSESAIVWVNSLFCKYLDVSTGASIELISFTVEFKEVVQELQRQLSDHSDSLNNALQQHMMSVEAKMADLRAEWRHSTPL